MFKFGSQDKKSSLDSALGAANDARDNERWLQAAAHYEVVLEIDSERADIWVQFAHCLKEFGALGEAVTAYRQSIKINPGEAETHVHLAHVFKRLGSYSSAKSEFQRAVALDPSDIESLSELDLLEEIAQAEVGSQAAVSQSNIEQLAVVDPGKQEETHQPVFREFEVTASHFAQEGAAKALNKKLKADLDILIKQNEGLQRELLKGPNPPKVTKARATRAGASKK